MRAAGVERGLGNGGLLGTTGFLGLTSCAVSFLPEERALASTR